MGIRKKPNLMNNGNSRIQLYSPNMKKHFKIKNCEKKNPETYLVTLS